MTGRGKARGETSRVQAAPRDETEKLSLNTHTLMQQQQRSDTVSAQTGRVNIGLCGYSWED